MKYSVLASGSKGNSIYLEINGNGYLIDIGISFSNLKQKLTNINVDLKKIKGIFITHAHSDHVNGLKQLIKNNNLPVYIKEGMLEELKKIPVDDNYVFLEKTNKINGFNVNVIKTSHDAEASVGYIFEYNDKKISIISDTGYINYKYHNILKGCDVYLIESNHDIEMLMNGRYPYYLKQRVLSDKGHLSNNDTAKYLSKFINEKTKSVVLTHISEENNTVEKAINTVKDSLKENNIVFDNIKTASQYENMELVEI